MIADGWTGLLLFFLLVAPGLLFDLRARRWRVSRQESPFVEVSRIALASIAFSAVGLLVALVAWRLIPVLSFRHDLFMLQTPYRVAHTGAALALLAISTASACALAWSWDVLGYKRAAKSGDPPELRADPEWSIAFRRQKPKGATPFVQVAMLDGSAWLGWVAAYTTESEDSRAIILAGPLAYRGAEEAQYRSLPKKWSRTILEGSRISAVTVQYLARPANADSD